MKLFERKKFDGIQIVYEFDNGYGASIIRHSLSFGGDEGLWELGVLSHTFNGAGLVFGSPICKETVGDLTWEDVEYILIRIENLPESETRTKEKEIIFRKF